MIACLTRRPLVVSEIHARECRRPREPTAKEENSMPLGQAIFILRGKFHAPRTGLSVLKNTKHRFGQFVETQAEHTSLHFMALAPAFQGGSPRALWGPVPGEAPAAPWFPRAQIRNRNTREHELT